MASDRRLTAGYAAPAVALVIVLAPLGWLGGFAGFYAVKLVLALAACGCVWLLKARTRRTNRMIARFVAALTHGDLTQSFRSSDKADGFDALGAAFDGALNRLRRERLAAADEARFAAALVDEAPAPLLAVDGEGVVHLANKAARRLFREADGRPTSHFRRYGVEFAALLAQAAPGARRVCHIRWNGLSQRAVVAIAAVDRQGQPWRIVSAQIIQRELDAAEMATQTDLVRVLTHEIMNSLTPVTSLAASAARMIDSLDPDDEEGLADIRLAIGALARRAAGIAQFVDSYRAFSDAPSVAIERFAAGAWAGDLVRAFEAMPQAAGIDLSVVIGSPSLEIAGDPNLLGQVLLNLLKNAGQAVAGSVAPRVELSISENDAGRILIRVSDNGPGIPANLIDEIFLPFFTTKPEGSGVGLSFAKQIALLHGGAIGVVDGALGGAAIQIVLGWPGLDRT